MTCEHCRDLFLPLVDGELGADARAVVEAHLAACAGCREELERFRRTVAALQGLGPERAPLGFVDRVLAAAHPAPWHRRLATRLFRPLRVMVPLEAMPRCSSPASPCTSISETRSCSRPRVTRLRLRPCRRDDRRKARPHRLPLLARRSSAQLNLDFLDTMPDAEVLDWLMSFKGVGPKTASVVLLVSLGKPAFPVDTHIYRVCGRLGLRPDIMNAHKAHTHLGNLFPPYTYFAAHLNLIRLGREICQARRPRCPACPLQELCQYYSGLQTEGRPA